MSVTFPEDPELRRVVREFFTRNGLKVPKDSETPGNFLPNVPVQFAYNFSPLPGDAAGVCALVTDFLRDCGKLKNDAPLSFHSEEAAEV